MVILYSKIGPFDDFFNIIMYKVCQKPKPQENTKFIYQMHLKELKIFLPKYSSS